LKSSVNYCLLFAAVSSIHIRRCDLPAVPNRRCPSIIMINAYHSLLALMCVIVGAQAITPDEEFLACCERQRRIPAGCYDFCNYNENGFNRPALEKMYIQNSAICPRDALGSYLFCAGNGADQRQGCEANGVDKTSAGKACQDLCDMRAGSILNLSWSHMPCLNVLKNVRETFRAHAERGIADGSIKP